MFHWKRPGRVALIQAGIIAACAFGLSACGGGQEGTTSAKPTPQGTIELSAVKVGAPEATFRDAVVTFVPDPKGSVGKSQYLSRGKDAHEGQFIANCKNDQCFLLQVYYTQNPIPKEAAIEVLQGLIPAGQTETKVDDSEVKAGKPTPIEKRYYGEYFGELVYTDKNADKVAIVNAWYPPAAVDKAAQ